MNSTFYNLVETIEQVMAEFKCSADDIRAALQDIADDEANWKEAVVPAEAIEPDAVQFVERGN